MPKYKIITYPVESQEYIVEAGSIYLADKTFYLDHPDLEVSSVTELPEDYDLPKKRKRLNFDLEEFIVKEDENA